jgi:uncharacterized membrane protein (UPF0127 family)
MVVPESGPMAWLLRDGQVLASLDVAESLGARVRGLAGRSRLEGALLMRNARGAHSIGVRFALDVAYLDGGLVVLRTFRLFPFMVGPPSLKTRAVLLAERGAFDRWSLKVGDHLETKE